MYALLSRHAYPWSSDWVKRTAQRSEDIAPKGRVRTKAFPELKKGGKLAETFQLTARIRVKLILSSPSTSSSWLRRSIWDSSETWQNELGNQFCARATYHWNRGARRCKTTSVHTFMLIWYAKMQWTNKPAFICIVSALGIWVGIDNLMGIPCGARERKNPNPIGISFCALFEPN